MIGIWKLTPRLAILGLCLFFLTTSVAAAQCRTANRAPRPARPRAAPGKVTAAELVPGKSGRSVKCPADFSEHGTITTDGPADVKYMWVGSDGRTWPDQTLKFKRAGSKPVSITWKVGKPRERVHVWLQVKVLSPNEVSSNKCSFEAFCEK